MQAAAIPCECVPRLSGQVTLHGDPFSAFPDPRPQPLCLVWMCPPCLVPYPIILCPRSKNQCSPIVLLTCSTVPIVCNTPCCLPSSLANISPFFPPICSIGLLCFSPHIHTGILILNCSENLLHDISAFLWTKKPT